MLLIDGAKYEEWIPPDEVGDYQPIINKHMKEIFGENCVVAKGKRIATDADIESIPDWFVFCFNDRPRWYIVEAELSSSKSPTQLYNHVNNQIGKFIARRLSE